MNVREEVRRATRRLLARQGFELRRMNSHDRSLDALLIRLLREKDPTVVLDVGANRGAFVDRIRGQGYEGRVISFEPLPQPFATLARRVAGNAHWDAVQLAISDAPGTATMGRSADRGGHVIASFNDRRHGGIPALGSADGNAGSPCLHSGRAGPRSVAR